MNKLLYYTYRSMLTRCYNSRHPSFKWYGARGITVCDSWRGKEGYNNFCRDMGEKPKGFSINRIDNDGPYSPDNCEWADRWTQQNNRRTNVRITLDDTTLTLAQWSRKIGIHANTIVTRKKNQWPMDKVLSEDTHSGYLISKDFGKQPSRIDPNWMISH